MADEVHISESKQEELDHLQKALLQLKVAERAAITVLKYRQPLIKEQLI